MNTEAEIRADERASIMRALDVARQFEGVRAQRIFDQCALIVGDPDHPDRLAEGA